ncbi:hypothetical protein C8R45DRAFT_1111403 [Mycena sanguinolenta]|nr:hypothetical protein C8R45DRAFT_1111403 [Mycena sanguinolenta]
MVHTLIVHFWTAPGKEAEMKAALLDAQQKFLKEAGVLNWFIMQDPKDSSAWSVVERSNGLPLQSLKAHGESPEFHKFVVDVGPLCTGAKEREVLSFVEF